MITDGFKGHLFEASDINRSGLIVGGFWKNSGQEYSIGSYLFTEGKVENLGFEGAKALNDMGLIVGSHFLYETHVKVDRWGQGHVTGGRLYNLNKLITRKVRQSCFRSTIGGGNCYEKEIKYEDLDVLDINNSGQIVGSAIIDGSEHAVLLTPNRTLRPLLK